ncbi:MAG: uroporphyrinogen decarboxylase family protein, partial [Thermodesulfobacteriota bacterium]
KPDRVPVLINVGSIPAYLYGLNYRTVSYDYERLIETWERFNREYAVALDSYAMPQRIFPSRVLDILDYRQYHWPGHGLPDDSRGYQYVEAEYMKADEYEAFIRDPSDFWLRTYLPRIFGALEPFQSLKSLTHIIELPMTDFMPLARPDIQAALLVLVEAGKEFGRWMQAGKKALDKMTASGYPVMRSTMAKAPFDTLGDTLRGTKGILLDMFRRPQKVLEAIDRITDLTISTVISSARAMKTIMVMFPLHKGADGWMNQKQFETFYWPSLKKVVQALVDEGLLVNLFAEGKYDSRLDSVNEFPKGSVCWWFDQTDMAEAKKKLGDRCCIQGNVPTSLLVTGSPQEVKQYCRKLIETCASGGGYILCPAASSDESRLENLLAMVEAAKEYGVY